MSKTKTNNLKLLLLASYFNNFGWAVYSPLYAIYVLKLGGSTFDISFTWGAYTLLAGVLMMFFGRLENSKRCNAAVMLVVGYGLFVVIAASFFFVHNIHQFYLLQGLLAVAMGILTPAARSSYARAEKRGKEAGQWGLYDGGVYVLIAAASISGGVLYKYGGFHTLFVTMLVIQVIATYAAIRNLQYNRRSKPGGGKRYRSRRLITEV